MLNFSKLLKLVSGIRLGGTHEAETLSLSANFHPDWCINAVARLFHPCRPISGARPPELVEKVELYYFYEGLCESCGKPGKYFAMLNEKLPSNERNRYPNDFPVYNVYRAFGRSKYEQITDSMDINRDTLTLPVLIAGGRVFQGFETIADSYLAGAEAISAGLQSYLERSPGSAKPHHWTFVSQTIGDTPAGH
jgi:hypothetical protein